MEKANQFVIQEWQRAYFVPGDHPEPESVRRTLDSWLGPKQTAELQKAVEPILAQEEGVWLINQIETNMTLDMSYADTRAAISLLGRQISEQIGHILRNPPDGNNVRYFPSRADFVGRFISDILDDRAWGRWEYFQFDALRSLSREHLLREVILREPPAEARAVLTRLAEVGRFRPWLDAVSDIGAGFVWDYIVAGETAPVRLDRSQIRQFVNLTVKLRLSGGKGWATAKNRLALWAAAVVAQRPPTGGKTEAVVLPARAAVWFTLLETLAAQKEQGPDLESLLALVEAETLEADWLVRETAVILPDTAVKPARQGGVGRFSSELAGLYLLLPTIADLKLPELLLGLAPSAEIGAIWFIWLAEQCLGRSNWGVDKADRALLACLGLDDEFEYTLYEQAGEALEGAQAELLGGLWQMLWQQRRIGGEALAFSELDAGTVVHDMNFDYWLAITAETAELLDQLVQIVDTTASQIWLATDPVPDQEPGQSFARKYKEAAAAYRYFYLNDLSRAQNEILMPLAQAVLRTFARRLPGFNWSSPGYLHSNFLAGIGHIQMAGPGQIAVQVAEVPLGTVLAITGFQGHSYAWSFNGERLVHVTLP